MSHHLVVVVCEHGVSPALKNPEVSNYKSMSYLLLHSQHRGHSVSLSSSVRREICVRTSQSFLM